MYFTAVGRFSGLSGVPRPLGVPEGLTWRAVWPYLVGSGLGGIAAGLWGRKIPAVWLHRVLGILILYGGFRYLC